MPTQTSSTDAIRKQITLKASPAKVWKAISDARQFSAWFGVELDGAFVEGRTVQGKAEYDGKQLAFMMIVERIEPERVIAFRWHPFAVDPSYDYDKEPMTLVELAIAPSAGGTLLTVTESGFDQIPEARRAQAFEMNSGGWAAQVQNIATYVDA